MPDDVKAPKEIENIPHFDASTFPWIPIPSPPPIIIAVSIIETVH